MLTSPGIVAEGKEFMSGEEIERAVTGAHMAGVEDGTTWKEYFDPAGSIEGSWAGRAYQGTWAVQSDRLCLDYQGTTDDGCWHLSRGEDGRLFWFTKDGTPDRRRTEVRLVPR